MTGIKHRIEDNVGQTFGKWEVLRFSHSDKHAGFMWLCRCECGLERTISASKLVLGKATSCTTCSRAGEPNTWPFAISYIRKVQRGALKRGIVFEVPLSHLHDVLQHQEGLCALTGVPLIFYSRHPEPQTASLDRIDSKQGYVSGNVQWLHKDVNRMKLDFDQEHFLELCRQVVAFENTDMTEAAATVACVVGGDC